MQTAMKNTSKFLVLAVFVLIVSAQLSFSQMVKVGANPDLFVDSKSEAYSQMYGANPGSSILIMPPINLTNVVEAKEYFYYTINTQLAASGWYVYPPILAIRTLQEESADNAELFVNADISKFKDVFGADYLLFTTIERWYKSNGLKKIIVTASYNLRSTRTNESVYEHQYTYAYDLSGVDKAAVDSAADIMNSSSGNAYAAMGAGLAMLGTMVATTIATGKTNTMDVARYCNAYALYDLPFGPLFGTQGDDADYEAADYSGGYTTNNN